MVGDELVSNLFLIVRPTGVKRWAYDAANTVNSRGRRIKMSLGTYPAYGLVDAREWATEQNNLRARGVDPRDALAEAKQEEERSNELTVEVVHGRYIAFKRRDALKTIDEKTRLMTQNVFPKFGAKPIRDFSKADVRSALNTIRDRGADGAANRVLTELKSFLKWASGEDYVEFSVAADLTKTRETGFRRDVTEQEMVWMWRATENYSVDERDAVRLMILTGCRRMEACASGLGEFRNGLWTIPRERAKNDLAAVLPLGPLGRTIFQEARARALEAGRTFHFHAAPYHSMFANVLTRLRKDVAELAAKEGETVEPWDFHSIRHGVRTNITFGNIMNKPLAEQIINHATGGIDRRYDKHLYIDEKRALLERWERHILAMVGDSCKLAA